MADKLLRSQTAHRRDPRTLVPRRLAALYRRLAAEVLRLAEAMGDNDTAAKVRCRAIVVREFGTDLGNNHYDLIIAEMIKQGPK